jgi:hypothetical protein
VASTQIYIRFELLFAHATAVHAALRAIRLTHNAVWLAGSARKGGGGGISRSPWLLSSCRALLCQGQLLLGRLAQLAPIQLLLHLLAVELCYSQLWDPARIKCECHAHSRRARVAVCKQREVHELSTLRTMSIKTSILYLSMLFSSSSRAASRLNCPTSLADAPPLLWPLPSPPPPPPDAPSAPRNQSPTRIRRRRRGGGGEGGAGGRRGGAAWKVCVFVRSLHSPSSNTSSPQSRSSSMRSRTCFSRPVPSLPHPEKACRPAREQHTHHTHRLKRSCQHSLGLAGVHRGAARLVRC